VITVARRTYCPGNALKTISSGRMLLLVAGSPDLMPDAIVYRPEAGFTLPFSDWLHGPLREEVESALLSSRFGDAVVDALHPTIIAEIWRRFLADKGEWIRPWFILPLKTRAEMHPRTYEQQSAEDSL
jgi:hypothetical protein